MSTLRQALQDYLEVRRSLGYKLKQEGRLLPEFLDHVEDSGSPFITTSVALAWAMRPAGATSNWWAARLCCVRGFARYAHALDPSNQVPPPDLLPHRSSRLTPYLYSDEEIEALMKATCILQEPIKPSTYATLIGLLATTGLRVNDARKVSTATLGN